MLDAVVERGIAFGIGGVYVDTPIEQHDYKLQLTKVRGYVQGAIAVIVDQINVGTPVDQEFADSSMAMLRSKQQSVKSPLPAPLIEVCPGVEKNLNGLEVAADNGVMKRLYLPTCSGLEQHAYHRRVCARRAALAEQAKRPLHAVLALLNIRINLRLLPSIASGIMQGRGAVVTPPL